MALLKRSANYDLWLEDIQKILDLDYCWLVIVGKKIAAKISQALPKKKLASIKNDETSVKAIVNMELAKDIYKAKIEKYEEKLLK
ncbi:hypothetical protein MMC31_000545, partial [Peltigera leucophlebia]|nr:hypothetical protein [Peltigera leucophlebia]